MKIERIRQEEGISILKICKLLNINRTQYYRKVFGIRDYKAKPKPGLTSNELQERIKQLCVANPEYGYRKIWALLRYEYVERISLHLVYNYMKKLGLLLSPAYTQQIKKQMEARKQYLHKPLGINELWQVDFTQFEITGFGFYYATNVMDYYSRYCLASLIRPQHTADELIQALEKAKQESIRLLGEDGFPERIILVIDNGPQMKARRFKRYLQGSIFKEVYARGHHPQTLGLLERFNRSQKYERIYLRHYEDPIEAERDLEEYRQKYNNYRPHQALGYQRPADVYRIENLRKARTWTAKWVKILA